MTEKKRKVQQCFNSIVDQADSEGFYQYARKIQHPGGMGNEGGVTFETLLEAIHKSIGEQEPELAQTRQDNLCTIILSLLTTEQITQAITVDSLPDHSLIGILTLGKMEMPEQKTHQLLHNLSLLPKDILDRQITDIGGGSTTINNLVEDIKTAQLNRLSKA